MQVNIKNLIDDCHCYNSLLESCAGRKSDGVRFVNPARGILHFKCIGINNLR